MRKHIVIAMILGIVLMFLAGCAQQQAAPAPVPKSSEPAKTVTSAPTQEAEPATTTTTTKTEPATTTTTTTKTMTKAMSQLLQKHIGRVTSLQYMYQDATNKPEEWETWIKDNKMHVKLREMDNVKEDVYIDNIYMDLNAQSAKGYCERAVYRCADPNTAVDVKFAKYYRKTPLEWIQEVTYAEKIAEEQMQSRTVWKIQYEKDGTTVLMWVDDYYGVPVKVKETKGSVVNDYIFEDIAFNSVDDSDLSHGLVTTTYKN
ncbi:hypothetical protein KY363_04290 [Candidatus Woesearchaeota archaeon]|nr:hypothetical protein [Candidatus Woesearchaeota archaeon]